MALSQKNWIYIWISQNMELCLIFEINENTSLDKEKLVSS